MASNRSLEINQCQDDMAADKITNNFKTTTLQISATAGANVSTRGVVAYRSGNIVVVEVNSAISNNGTIVQFSSGLPQPVSLYATAFARSLNGDMAMISLEAADTTEIRAWGTVPQGSYYYALFTYVVR